MRAPGNGSSFGIELMETQYYILLSIKTPQGFVDYGQYFFGNDREAAYGLFRQLKGNPTISANCLLHIDLMETVNGLPEKIRTICCTLDELGANSKLIARAIFRLKNLEEML
jgi:hypothetical protein